MLQSVDIAVPPGSGWAPYSIPILGQHADLPFHIRKIDGLNPVDADINTTESDQDDDLYLGSRTGKRNIVITFGLNWPPESARGTLHSYFKTGRPVTLNFVYPLGFGGVENIKQITGYVETIEDDHFSDDPEMVVSIICPKSDFINPDVLTLTGQAGIDPDVAVINYNGTKDGQIELEFDIGFGGSYSGDVTIEHFNPGSGVPTRIFKLNNLTATDAPEGWKMYYSSERGKKKIEVNNDLPSALVTKSLLWAMDNQSFWLSLFPGDNNIRVLTETDAPIKNWTLTSYERFGGLL